MVTFRVCCLGFAVLLAGACSIKNEIPLEFPTPPPNAASTPLPFTAPKRAPSLEQEIIKISEAAKGRVGVAAVLIEDNEAAFVDLTGRYPMQSVYKLPIAMAAAEKAKRGDIDLDEKIGVLKSDMVRQGMRSPIRDANPNAGEFTIRELIRYAIVESDGTASDVLLRVVGGPSEVKRYLSSIANEAMKVVNTEKEMGADWQLQYDNWSTPGGSVGLLQFLFAAYTAESNQPGAGQVPPDQLEGARLIMHCLYETVTAPNRLRGMMPKGGSGLVAHKSGTSGTKDGITAATNDIGFITLDDGRHIAIAVFVSDSPADEKTRDSVIARIAKAAYDHWNTPRAAK